MAKRVVVLGGGFAGVLAARRIAATMGDEAKVLLVSNRDAFVERVRFHELASGRPIERWPLAQLLSKTGAKVLHATARAIDPVRRSIDLVTASGATASIDYDTLVYALGSGVDRDGVPGVREHAASVHDEDSSRDLAARIAALPDRAEVVVCGGGMTGVELATEVAELHPRLRVRLVTRDEPCEPLVPSARAYLRRVFARMRIEVETGVSAREVGASEIVTDRGARRADLCVWAASFAVPRLAREAGLAVHARGQLEVDEQLRSTSHPEVFGAGDAALPTCTVPIRMGCATAMPMGAFVSDNVVATLREQPLHAFRFAYMVRLISLGRHDGIGQVTRPDDSPRSWLLTGRLASMVKELTFRMNAFGLQTGIYPWRVLLLAAPRLAAAERPHLDGSAGGGV